VDEVTGRSPGDATRVRGGVPPAPAHQWSPVAPQFPHDWWGEPRATGDHGRGSDCGPPGGGGGRTGGWSGIG